MKFRLHPILLPVFLFLMITDGLSVYALIFISLLLHEAGHLVAAKLTGMRVRSCTIMPYGGELDIPNRLLAPKKDRLFVALGGPIATVILLVLALMISFPGNELFIQIQIALLFLNLLPILPLDGGQAIAVFFDSQTGLILFSIVFLSIATLLLTVHLPIGLPYLLLTLFLLIQNISAFRFRKYEKAFLDLKLNRLTR